MERNNIEDLFKNKLEGYVMEPSSETKERFQGMIRSKRRKVLTRRIGIAASILLFAFAGIYSFRSFNTDKIDLTDSESFDTRYGTEMVTVKEMPDPGTIPSNEDEVSNPESEMTNNLKSSLVEDPSNKYTQSEVSTGNSLAAQTGENEKNRLGLNSHTSAGDNLEFDQLTEEEVEESTYIEYFVADPDILEEDQVREPMKITIEYIPSGKKDPQSESKRKNFYSKLDNMKTMNEVLGDLRSYKDRLFALDFKKEEKVNNEEKSKE